MIFDIVLQMECSVPMSFWDLGHCIAEAAGVH